MLILERSIDRAICVGRDVKIHLLEVLGKNRVRLGVEAPRDMPVWRDEMGAWQEQLPPAQESSLARLRILVVEDDVAQGKIITRILRQSPTTQVTLAKTGHEAREQLEESAANADHRPDLILMDYRLPDANGDELVEYARSFRELRNVPIVMLSCASEEEQVMDCLDAGANAFIEKSEGLDEFRSSVLRIVDFWSHAQRVA